MGGHSTINATKNGLKTFLVAAKRGVEKAADSLEALSSNNIRMEVISAGVAPTSRLAEVAGSPEDIVVGVYIAVVGDIAGHALLVFSYDSALKMIDMIMGLDPGTTSSIDEMESSVMQEMGNIVTSSLLNALSDYYGRSLLPSPPSVAVDMAAAVIDSVLLNTGHFDEDTISIVTRFAGNEQVLKGFFLYIPEITV